tara:strand:+ start:81 stop:275 length:195 start_codon:yes stop_codon:yes gene_type:complete
MEEWKRSHQQKAGPRGSLHESVANKRENKLETGHINAQRSCRLYLKIKDTRQRGELEADLKQSA